MLGRVPGVVAYRVEQGEGGPHLNGQWTALAAGGQVFAEKLTKLARPLSRPPVPEHRDPGSLLNNGKRA